MIRWFFRALFFLEVAAVTFFITTIGMLPFAVATSCLSGRSDCPGGGIEDLVAVAVFFLLLPELCFLSVSFHNNHPVIFHALAAVCLIWLVAFLVLL